jgi:hypothetical protein
MKRLVAALWQRAFRSDDPASNGHEMDGPRDARQSLVAIESALELLGFAERARSVVCSKRRVRRSL